MAQVESLRGRPAQGSAVSPRALSIEGVTKRYGEKYAVRGVSLAVRPGSIHGLVGPNGSGKSTILRSVLGLVRPDAGTITVLGEDRREAAARPREGLAGLVDDPRFYPYLSARVNLRILARLDGGPAADADALLERAGLARAAGERVGGFSLGMRQRLGLAAALMRAPRVLLLDEPANGLDPNGAEELWRVVRELAAAGTAILLSSHDLVTIDDVCDELTVLRAGRVAWSGAIAELRALAPAPEHILRTADDEAAAQLLRGLELPVEVQRDAVRVMAADDVVERLTVELGQAGVGVRSLAPGASPLRILFSRLTEGPLPELTPAEDQQSSVVPPATPAPGIAADGTPRPGSSRRTRRMTPADLWAVAAVEARKLSSQARPRALLALCLVGPWLFMLAVKGAGSVPSDTLFGEWMLQSSAALPLVVLTFAASWLFPLLGSLVGGDTFSSEDRLGTWPTLLTRSRPQSAIVAGKVLVSIICTLVFVIVLALSASLAGLALARHGALPGLTGQLLPGAHAFRLVAAAWAASLPTALAWTSLALVLSTGTRNSIIGIAVPALIGVLLQVLWLIDGPPLLRTLTPSAPLDAWHGLFEAPQSVGPLIGAIVVACGWTLLGVIALGLLIRRRDAVAP